MLCGLGRENRLGLSWGFVPHRKRSNFRSLFEFFPMPATVLVVDDERDTNDILANLVQTRGLEPIQVFSAPAECCCDLRDRSPI